MHIRQARSILLASAATAFLTLSAVAGYQYGKPPIRQKPVAGLNAAKPEPEPEIRKFEPIIANAYGRDLDKLNLASSSSRALTEERLETTENLGHLTNGCESFAHEVSRHLDYWPEEVSLLVSSIVSPIHIYPSTLPKTMLDALPERSQAAFATNEGIGGSFRPFFSLSYISLDQFSPADTVHHEIFHALWDRMGKDIRSQLMELLAKEPLSETFFQLMFSGDYYCVRTNSGVLMDAARTFAAELATQGDFQAVREFMEFDQRLNDFPAYSFATWLELSRHIHSISRCFGERNPRMAYEAEKFPELSDSILDSLATELFAYTLDGAARAPSKLLSQELLRYLSYLTYADRPVFADFFGKLDTSSEGPSRLPKFLCTLISPHVEQALGH